MVTADAFGDLTAPLLIVAAGLAIGGLALWVERRRTLAGRSPSLADWQRTHGHAVDEYADVVDGIVDGSTPDAERPDDAMRRAIAACPHRRLRRELETTVRAGGLACRRAAKGRRPGVDHRLYLASLDRAAAIVAAADSATVSDAAPTGPPA